MGLTRAERQQQSPVWERLYRNNQVKRLPRDQQRIIAFSEADMDQAENQVRWALGELRELVKIELVKIPSAQYMIDERVESLLEALKVSNREEERIADILGYN